MFFPVVFAITAYALYSYDNSSRLLNTVGISHIKNAKMQSPYDMQQYLKSIGYYIDMEISGKPKYLEKKMIHSPGAEGIQQHSMFDDDTLTEGYTRIVKKPGDPIVFGEGWHSDLMFYATPPHVTMIRGVSLYRGQTHTGFRDMRTIYDKLPSHLKERLNHAVGNNTDGTGRYALHSIFPVVEGRKSVYASRAFTRSVVGHPDSVLKELLDEIDKIGHQVSYNVTWNENDILIWNNKIVQHCAYYSFPKDSYREIHRVIGL